MATQQKALFLGIKKLIDTYRELDYLNFSNCVLGEIEDSVDDLIGLLEDDISKEFLITYLVKYNKEKGRYYIKGGRNDR